MAVDPLYTAVKSDFLNKIRLKSAKSDQTLAVIDVAISNVRLGFFKSLTSRRALEIAAFTPSDNPTTENEVLQSTAAVTEVLWVTALLVDLLPTVFMEGEAEARQSWNEEPLTRDASGLQKFKNSLLTQVQTMLGTLEEPENKNAGPVKVASIGRTEPHLVFENHVGKIGRPFR